jgi:hypothetical protein
MVEEPTQYVNVPFEAIKEGEPEDSEKKKDHENCNDHENEKEQPTIVLFIQEQLEVLLKMNRPNFTELVTAFKGRSSKGARFKFAKLGNFDRVRNQKVVDVWLVQMEDYLHVAKIGRHLALEFA